MKSHSLETNYVSLRAELQAQVNQLTARWPSLSGFWERWCLGHQQVLHALSGRELTAVTSEKSDDWWTEFLRQRQRMVSALSQGLKLSAADAHELREELKNLLREHDLRFINLLQKELEQVKEQMSHAFTVKKTMTAYAQTAQYRGE